MRVEVKLHLRATGIRAARDLEAMEERREQGNKDFTYSLKQSLAGSRGSRVEKKGPPTRDLKESLVLPKGSEGNWRRKKKEMDDRS